MRFTVSLEEDLYRVAKSKAKTEDTSISKAVNRLIRKGLESTQHPPTKKGKKGAVSTFPVSGAQLFRVDCKLEKGLSSEETKRGEQKS